MKILAYILLPLALVGCHDEQIDVHHIYHDGPDAGQLIFNCAARDDGCSHACFFSVDDFGEAVQEGNRVIFTLDEGAYYVYANRRLWCQGEEEVFDEFSDTFVIQAGETIEWTY